MNSFYVREALVSIAMLIVGATITVLIIRGCS